LATFRNNKEYKAINRTILLTVRDESFLALYKGVTPTLRGAIPVEGVTLHGWVDEITLPLSSDQDVSGATTHKSSPPRKMIFGGLGGVMAGLITQYPNDTVRRLLQLQGSRGPDAQYYNGYMDCVLTTYRNEGIARLYRGVT
jgi:hypothetical protein